MLLSIFPKGMLRLSPGVEGLWKRWRRGVDVVEKSRKGDWIVERSRRGGGIAGVSLGLRRCVAEVSRGSRRGVAGVRRCPPRDSKKQFRAVGRIVSSSTGTPRCERGTRKFGHSVQNQPFELDGDAFLVCLRTARRGAGAAPSGMTADHLFPILESEVDSGMLEGERGIVVGDIVRRSYLDDVHVVCAPSRVRTVT